MTRSVGRSNSVTVSYLLMLRILVRLAATVVGLLRYATFHDLFSHNDPCKFGGESVEWLERQMNEFYSLDEQLQKSVVGIEFVLVP